MRTLQRFVASFVAFVLLFGLWTSPAGAHTGFESSDPSDGAVIDHPVELVTLVFSGAAEPTGEGFQVLDAQGQLRTPTEVTANEETTVWELRFDPALASGTIGFRWMVKAPDAHPINGSFRFDVAAELPDPQPVESAIEAPTQVPRAAPTATADTEASGVSNDAVDEPPPSDDVSQESPTESTSADRTVEEGSEIDLEAFLDVPEGAGSASAGRLATLGRIVGLTAAMIAVGAMVFGAVVLRGSKTDIRHVMHWVRRLALLAALGALVEFIAQLTIDGGSWTSTWAPTTWSSVLGSTFGFAIALRIIGGIVLTATTSIRSIEAIKTTDLVAAINSRIGVGAAPHWEASHFVDLEGQALEGPPESLTDERELAWRASNDSWLAFAAAATLLVSYAFDGHTVTEGHRIVTAIVDFIHVAGGAVWAGGLVMLVAILWRRHRAGVEIRALQLAVRFSVLASLSLVVVGIAGVALTVIILDAPSDIWATPWGRLLMAKTALVTVVAALGAYNHKVLVPQMSAPSSGPDDTAHFRKIATFETTIMVSVLITTAFLVGAAS